MRALWRKLIDVETELYTEAVSDSNSEYSRQHRRHFVEYSLSRGTIDFDRNDQIEVKMPHPKRDDWITLGRLDVNLSDSKLLAIDDSYARRQEAGILCREGTRLRFISLFEMDSRNRRNRATTRILDGQSVIHDLIDYFHPLTEPETKTYGPVPADLPSRFWRNASNFRGLSEFLLHYVATIILVYNENYLDFNLYFYYYSSHYVYRYFSHHPWW